MLMVAGYLGLPLLIDDCYRSLNVTRQALAALAVMSALFAIVAKRYWAVAGVVLLLSLMQFVAPMAYKLARYYNLCPISEICQWIGG